MAIQGAMNISCLPTMGVGAVEPWNGQREPHVMYSRDWEFTGLTLSFKNLLLLIL